MTAKSNDAAERPGETSSSLPEALSESVGFLLALLGAESRRRFVEVLEVHGLRLAHYGTLMTLAELGPISQQRLARAIGIDPRNAVPMVDSLEQNGLIERGADPVDRRRHRVALTTEGRALFDRVRETGQRLERELLAGLEEHERAQLRSVLAKLYASLAPG